MLTFYLAGKWLGRARSPLGAVLAAGVATLIVNPLALDNSGFELSYAVVLGLILYAPLLFAALRAKALPWRDVPAASLAPWQKCGVWLWEKLVGMAVTSWTAVLGSAPLTAEFFGVFSAHILFLNLILFPLTCGALWAGALAVAAGLVKFAPLTWLSWLANGAGLALVGLMQKNCRHRAAVARTVCRGGNHPALGRFARGVGGRGSNAARATERPRAALVVFRAPGGHPRRGGSFHRPTAMKRPFPFLCLLRFMW
jgi:predicted membrane metal-binding protein